MKQNWVKLPSKWIERGELKLFKWKDDGSDNDGPDNDGLDNDGPDNDGPDNDGSDNTAALMALIAIAHRVDQTTGRGRMTYDELVTSLDISRAKLSRGLSLLERRNIIQRWKDGRSSIRLIDYDPDAGWCKLPYKNLYKGSLIEPFSDFRLRSKVELDAMRLYLLFASRRDNSNNLANISMDKITRYTGIHRSDIKPATSMLASLSMAYTERITSSVSEYGVANAYRLVGIDSHRHMGTSGRGQD